MSTKTDVIAGSALLSMLEGMQSDRKVEKARESELVRAEGLARLKSKIADEGSLSGYVDKDTGKDIKSSELEKYPPERRMTKADYALTVTKKKYVADREMKAGEREEIRTQKLEDLDRTTAGKKDVEKIKQEGLMNRKAMDVKEKRKADELNRKKEEIKTAKDERKFKLDAAKVKAGYKKEYDSYVLDNTPDDPTLISKGKSLLGFEPEESPEVMPFDEWFSTNYATLAELTESVDKKEKSSVADEISRLLSKGKKKK